MINISCEYKFSKTIAFFIDYDFEFTVILSTLQVASHLKYGDDFLDADFLNPILNGLFGVL